MRATLLLLALFAASTAFGQQIPCAKYDDQQGPAPSEYAMKGCRSFNELQAAGGIDVVKTKGFKSYACFATTLPEESSGFFIVAEIGGVISFAHDDEHNGIPSIKTFSGGVKANDGFTNMTWTQYPKENPFFWSPGTWVGHGDAQVLMGYSGEAGKSNQIWDLDSTSKMKAMHVPQLHVSVDSDTARLRLDLNNDQGAVEELQFNRWTGRARLDITGEQRSLRCVTIGEQ